MAKHKNIESDILSHILTIGGGGMVGSYVDFGTKLGRKECNITNIAQVLSVVRAHKPKIILHLAAETNVDLCEKNPEQAYLVNATGTYHVAYAAREVGAKLIYISTAGVFDGIKKDPYEEHDIPSPINFYGHSKFAGECIVRGMLPDHLILRVCWMMGGGAEKDKKFVGNILRQLKDPGVRTIRAVSDQYGSPTFAKDLISAIKILASENKKGTYHMANRGSASRYDMARVIVRVLRPDVAVEPVPSSSFALSATRPNNEALISQIDSMRGWEEALEEYLLEEWKI